MPNPHPYTFGTEVSEDEREMHGGYTVHLASCGNPDFRQQPGRSLPGIPKRRTKVKTLDEASAACRTYIAEHELGSGNWAGGQVFQGNQMVALVSYNGRVWHPVLPRSK